MARLPRDKKPSNDETAVDQTVDTDDDGLTGIASTDAATGATIVTNLTGTSETAKAVETIEATAKPTVEATAGVSGDSTPKSEEIYKATATASPTETKTIADTDTAMPQVTVNVPMARGGNVLQTASNFVVSVSNGGFTDITEPLTLTTLKAGKTTVIRCDNAQQQAQVRSNLKQFVELGRPLEIKV